MARNSLLPRPRTARPAGAMSAPRWAALTLAVSGSQIFLRDLGHRWWTIAETRPCTTSGCPPSCAKFLLSLPDGEQPPPGDDGEPWVLHWKLTDEGWIRHPIGGGS